MTQKLTISFVNDDPFSINKWSWLSALLFLVSVLLLIQIGVYYLNQHEAIKELNEKLARMQVVQSQSKADVSVKKNTFSEIKLTALQKKQINETIGELIIDWDGVFKSIENTLMDDIAILEISPNSKKKMIVIRGEAKTLKSVFAYIKALDDMPNFSKVYLQTHNVDDSDVSKPVSFTLSAEWQLHEPMEK